MRMLLRITVVLAVMTFIGCGGNNTTSSGPDATTITPTASGVFPANGFAGRTLRVEVTGDDTKWSASTTVSFGAGVAVNDVTVASPTDLFADITIADTAAVGKNDLTVTDAGGMFTLSKAFEIDLPSVVSFQGTTAQGAIATFTITDHDVANPFDTTSVLDPNTFTTTFPNIAITAPSGVAFLVQNVSDFQISGVATLDIDATPGNVTVASGPTASVTSFPTGNLAVATRTATALTA
jgi:hypothetical protein